MRAKTVAEEHGPTGELLHELFLGSSTPRDYHPFGRRPGPSKQ